MSTTTANDTIVKEIAIKAPAERVFEALTNPQQRLKWWGAEGVYRGTHMPSWEKYASETLVRFDLDEKDGVTRVRLTHSGLTTEASRDHHKGWPQVLAWLRSYVET